MPGKQARLLFEIPAFPVQEATASRHTPHTHIWSPSLAPLAAAVAMATLTAVALVGRGGDTRGRGGAWAAERAVAAVLAAAGGGGWMRRLAAALLAAAMRGRRCCGGDAALSSRLTCARDSKHWQSAGAAGAFECARRAGRLLDGHSRESG